MSRNSFYSNILFLFYLFCLLFCIPTAHSQQYAIRVSVNPSGCRGGEVCDVQPQVIVINRSTEEIVYGFTGTVYAELSVPNEDENADYYALQNKKNMFNDDVNAAKLYIGSCTIVYCGDEVIGSLASVPFVNGVAAFQDLFILTAGEGYRIRFIGRNSGGSVFAATYSSPFEVTIGAPYKIRSNFIERSEREVAGQPLTISTLVSIVDRGNNPIKTINSGRVTVSLINTPSSISPTNLPELLKSKSGIFYRDVKNGYVKFSDLYINTSGTGYRLEVTYTPDADDPLVLALNSLTSSYFTVKVGQAAKLKFVSNTTPLKLDDVNVATTPWLLNSGGEFFPVCPSILILDAGDNIIEDDSASSVLVTMVKSRSGSDLGSTILPPGFNHTIFPDEFKSSLFVRANKGRIDFSSFIIDKIGLDYVLNFDLYAYNGTVTPPSYSRTDISLQTSLFDIVLGSPMDVKLLQQANGAWAGNQNWDDQPILSITDRGGNIIEDDSQSTVTISMAKSLSANFENLASNQIIVHTEDAPSVGFDDLIVYKSESGNLYPGDEIIITLQSTFNISIIPFKSASSSSYCVPSGVDVSSLSPILYSSYYGCYKPRLKLNTTPERYAEWVYDPFPNTIHTFKYVIQLGDVQRSAALVVSIDIPNSNIFLLDKLNRDVDLTIPTENHISLSFVKDADGNIQFYKSPIQTPSIFIDSSAPTIVSIEPNVTSGIYYPGEVIEFKVIYDQPIIAQGDIRMYFEVDLESALGASNLVISNSNLDGSYLRWFNPTTQEFYSISQANTRPNINYYPVVMAKFISAEENALKFIYKVQTGHMALIDQLRITKTSLFLDHIYYSAATNIAGTVSYSEQVKTEGYIRKHSGFKFSSMVPGGYTLISNPTSHILGYTFDVSRAVDSSLDLSPSISNFHSNYIINLDSVIPNFESSGIISDSPDGTYYPGDELFFKIKYDKPIQVFGSSISLILDLQIHPPLVSSKQFLSYKQPKKLAILDHVEPDEMTLVFKYEVEPYVSTTHLDIISYNALALGPLSHIKARSTHPILNANILTDNVITNSNSLGDNSNIVISGEQVKIVSIAVDSSTNGADFYPDDYILINVVFSAPVTTHCSPVFKLENINKEAEYVSGLDSNTLTFRYTVQTGDSATFLTYNNVSPLLPKSSKADEQDPVCNLFVKSQSNTFPVLLAPPAVGSPVLVDITGKTIGIKLHDCTLHPINPFRSTTITSVTTITDPGTYGVGTVFYFSVNFSDKVYISPPTSISLPIEDYYPKLDLNIAGKYAKFWRGNFESSLIFRYETETSDSNPIFEVLPSTSFTCSTGTSCIVKNFAGQNADLTLSSGIIASSGLYIDGTAPTITSVSIQDMSQEYSGKSPLYGLNITQTNSNQNIVDTISYSIITSLPVVVIGAKPKLNVLMTEGSSITKLDAWYDEKKSTDTNLIFTAKIINGVILPDKLSWETSSIDLNSNNAKILRKTDKPTTPLILSLPSHPTVPASVITNRYSSTSLSIPSITGVSKLYQIADVTTECNNNVLDFCDTGPNRIKVMFHKVNEVYSEIDSVTNQIINRWMELSVSSDLPRYDEAIMGSRKFVAGDKVFFMVKFDNPVMVWGNIFVKLNLSNRVAFAKYVGYIPLDSSLIPGFSGIGYNGETELVTLLNGSNGYFFKSYHPTQSSDATKALIFEYLVEESDVSINLEYTDTNSLVLGHTDDGYLSYIKRFMIIKSSSAENANIVLPIPGVGASLSSDGLRAYVNGRKPYIKNIEYISPTGVYNVGSSVQFKVEFSNEVYVEGYPYIIMETGFSSIPDTILDNLIQFDENNRDSIISQLDWKSRANYISGSNSKTLIFEYIPSPGDESLALDYFCDINNYNSAENSFVLNGGNIFAAGGLLTLKADLFLNSPKGILEGTPTMIAEQGKFTFLNNHITRMGKYKLIYSLSPNRDFISSFNPFYIDNFNGVITGFNSALILDEQYDVYSDFDIYTSQNLTVSFSSEYQLRSNLAVRNESIGRTLDVDGDFAVIGAPNFNMSVTPIQVVKVNVETGAPRREVQLLATAVEPRPTIISFYTTADVGAQIYGNFRIRIGPYGPSSAIPYNADSNIMQSILSYDLAALGNITVEVENYLFCGCENAFRWKLTLNDVNEGPVLNTVIDDSGLIGLGASVGPVTVVQAPSYLDGYFTVSMEDGVISRNIPYNSDESYLKESIELLGYPVFSVSIISTGIARNTIWSITFDAKDDLYDVPLIKSQNAGLTGGTVITTFSNVNINGLHGPNGITGTFQLEFRNCKTVDFPIDASASFVKNELEKLDSINRVNVRRNLFNEYMNTYMWIIEFVDVNLNTKRGFIRQDPIDNIEPITTINNIKASSPEVLVESKYYFGDVNRIYSFARQGTYGEGAGAAFVYQRVNQTWVEAIKLVGNNTKEFDHFGASVSINNDVIAIGAIGASQTGQQEIQGIRCIADSGYFKLYFRGWTTDALPYDIDRQSLYDSILSKSNELKKLYSVTRIEISDYTGGLCSNQIAYITFFSPTDYAGNLDNTDTGPNLELLTFINVNLTNSDASPIDFEIFEVQPGTKSVNGPNVDKENIGAVYLFRKNPICPVTNTADDNLVCIENEWLQEGLLYPTADISSTSFGKSVSVWGDYVVIGAPGSFAGSGAVYVYQYDHTTKRWEYLQVFNDPSVSESPAFGSSVALYDKTFVASTPYLDDKRGGVYVYQKQDNSNIFTLFQVILTGSLKLSSNSLFGFSLSIYKENLVISAPGYYEEEDYYIWHNIGKANSPTASNYNLGRKMTLVEKGNVGAVFYYTRSTSFSTFNFQQKLLPSNIKQGDRFGFDVDISDNVIVATTYGSNSGGESVDGPTATSITGSTLPSYPIMNIEFDAAPFGTVNRTEVSGPFRLLWKSRNITELYLSIKENDRRDKTFNITEMLHLNLSRYDTYGFITRPLFVNITAHDLKVSLEEDLHTGKVQVTRLPVDKTNGCYAWRVTFLQSPFHGRWAQNHLELFKTDISKMSGTNLKLYVNWINEPQNKIRGKVHVFSRSSGINPFVEQFHLSPHRQQNNDRFGVSVAISDPYVFVGASNRDLIPIQQNSGAAFVYDLQPLSIKFKNGVQLEKVIEGNDLAISTEFDESLGGDFFVDNVHYYISTLDRNANISTQEFFQDRYSVDYPKLSPGQTILEYLGLSGTAHARSQYYGDISYQWTSESSSNPFDPYNPPPTTSVWVDGLYDYRGISDYTPIHEASVLTQRKSHVDRVRYPSAGYNYVTLKTSNDSIIERPEDRLSLYIHSPGLISSPLGKLFYTAVITDESREGTSFIDGIEHQVKFLDEGTLRILNQNQVEDPLDKELTANFFGSKVVTLDELGVTFISSPNATILGRYGAGKVLQYSSNNPNDAYVGETTDSALPNAIFTSIGNSGNGFGSDIAASVHPLKTIATLAISEVKLNKVYLYVSTNIAIQTPIFTYAKTLQISDSSIYQNKFGSSLSFAGNLLFVGCVGKEIVHVYALRHTDAGYVWDSTPTQILKSSDYDYDILGSFISPHRQGFGFSLAASLSSRSLVVGSPYANYDNSGDKNLVELVNTEGWSINTLGSGKAYVFSSAPAVKEACILASKPLKAGSFQFIYTFSNLVEETTSLNFNSQNFEVEKSLNEFTNLELVTVSKREGFLNHTLSTSYAYCWQVSFNWEMTQSEVGKLEIAYSSSSTVSTTINALDTCTICTDFDADILTIQVVDISEVGELIETTALSPPDAHFGDKFGFSVGIDNDQIIVGSPNSPMVTRSTWDFEIGNLNGWSKTGNAFDYQPTYGDNSRYHFDISNPDSNHYSYKAANMKGNYYINTYELRPGNASNPLLPHSAYPPGSIQGFEPTGTLTSDPFIIKGDTISFYIGGGCDIENIYIELVVDGFVFDRKSGNCRENLELKTFDVKSVLNKAAIIKIVDNSSKPWGFISIDNIAFSWDNVGASIKSSNNFMSDIEKYNAQTEFEFYEQPNPEISYHGGLIDTPQAGGAYIYSLINSTRSTFGYASECKSSLIISSQSGECLWGLQKKIFPSNVRAFMHFGYDVAINKKIGTIFVSAPNIERSGFFGETLAVNPYVTFDGTSISQSLRFPLNPRLTSKYLFNFSSYQRNNVASGIWELMKLRNLFPSLDIGRAIGAIYAYNFITPHKVHTNERFISPTWSTIENVRFQPLADSDQNALLFGFSISSSGSSLVVGAPGASLYGNSSVGSAYYYRANFAGIKFLKPTFHFLEGSSSELIITLTRDISINSDSIKLYYSTSDISARGVNKEKYEYCMTLPPNLRSINRCGDYLQSSGNVRFNRNENKASIVLNIIDDTCYERDSKLLLVSLSIPGGTPLIGSDYMTLVKIDDDDFISSHGCYKEDYQELTLDNHDI